MTEDPTPAVAGIPRLLLRLEGAALLIVAVAMFWQRGGSWWLFAVLILAPDSSFLGYLAGPRVGAIMGAAAALCLIYEQVHTTYLARRAPRTRDPHARR